jgi:hypothetical protein
MYCDGAIVKDAIKAKQSRDCKQDGSFIFSIAQVQKLQCLLCICSRKETLLIFRDGARRLNRWVSQSIKGPELNEDGSDELQRI